MRDSMTWVFFIVLLTPQHRDLAARNILIDKTMLCRIGDFGLSVDLSAKDEDENSAYAGEQGNLKVPIRWTSIEVSFHPLPSSLHARAHTYALHCILRC